MKKIISLIIILLPYITYAENVTVEKARKIAENFLSIHSNSRSSETTISLIWNGESKHSRSSKYAPAYYVFESSAKSFVIVAGDDVVNPILGYSEEGGFNINDMPDNIKWWMNELREGINYLRENNIKADKQTEALWDNATFDKATSRAVESSKLLETAKWNQAAPFYDMCPKINGEKTYQGCTPTAVAIVMRYYKWPKAGHGVLDSYHYIDRTGVPQFIEGYSLGHEYNWDNMPLKFSNYTQVQADEVARLIRDCAIASKAEFNVVGSSGTGAYLKDAMIALAKHMSYDTSAFYYEKSMFTDLEWHKMLYQSINSNNPVLYTAYETEEWGHTIVLDGYDSEGNFHINWGWGGQCDGYYNFPNFREFSLSKMHYAVLGLKKEEGGIPLEVIALGTGYDCMGIKFCDGEGYHVEKGVAFNIELGFLSNKGIENFNGQVFIVIVDKEGEIKETLSTITINELQPNHGYKDLQRTCKVTKEIEIGDRIKLYYKSNKSDEWEPVWYVKEEGFVSELPIADQYYIEEVTSFEYKVEEKRIEIITKPDVIWNLYNQDGSIITKDITFDNGKLSIDVSGFNAGTYTLNLSKGKDVKELNFILGGK